MPDSNAGPVVDRLKDRDACDVWALAEVDPIHYREGFAFDVDTYRRPEHWSTVDHGRRCSGRAAARLKACTPTTRCSAGMYDTAVRMPCCSSPSRCQA